MNRMKLPSIWLLIVAAFVAPSFAQANDRFPVALWDKTGEPKEPPPAKWRGVTKKAEVKTNYFVPTGFVLPARLEHSIYSQNAEAPAIALIERDVEYLHRVVIPAQTRVIGTVLVEKSHDRVLISWSRLIFPTGDEIAFSGLALSQDGSLGIKGKVETYKMDSAVANTVLRSVVAGTQAVLEASNVSAIASQAAQGVSQEALKALDTDKQQVTTSITVDADTGIRVYVNQRLEY